MTVIRIQECTELAGIFQAKVSFNQGPQYDITVRDPFSKEEEERLEWYFEEHLKSPFIDQIKAQEAVTSITEYGEKLFEQVFFADIQILSAYNAISPEDLKSLQIEIVGQPSFHALHWEAIKDPKSSCPLALQATIVRKNPVPQTFPPTKRLSPTINLLVITARPFGKQDISYRTISRPLVESLHRDKLSVKIDILRPGTYKALENHLHIITEQNGVGYYHVIHFDVHGAVLPYPQIRHLLHKRYGRDKLQPYEGMKAFLFLEGEKDNSSDPLEATELAQLLVTHKIPIAILNACQSGKQVGGSETSLASHLMQAGVQLVLAMSYSITVSAAKILMSNLYQHLFEGYDLPTAICYARQELANHKERHAIFNTVIDLEDWLLPVIYQNQPLQLQLQPFDSQKKPEHSIQQAMRYRPSQPQYGFVSRDLDILQIEKRLLLQRNILLLRAMGGAGKTTLLQHLGWWWQSTGFVGQVCYFGYDEKAWTRLQLITSIAQHLFDEKTYQQDFQPLSLDAQQVKLVQHLRTQRHLLILDNLETISSIRLGILHTLSSEEQEALHRLLSDLAGGKTLVLLGSRSGEEWLAKETFGENIYDLPGLDPEAASILTERILKQYGVTQYREDDKLLDLIRLLDGFPLALEVVLANLAYQSPAELLAVLQGRNVNLNTDSSNERTRSILNCIDYTYSHLSPETQQILLCLAPFTSVIYLKVLEIYSAFLELQPLLANLPFERWNEVLDDAKHWGLLQPDQKNLSFLHLHPMLPYFLRSRLAAPEQIKWRQAIEATFSQIYELVSLDLWQLLSSKNPQKWQAGHTWASLEYENLVMALEIVLVNQNSVINLYRTLSLYLQDLRDHERALELGNAVLNRLVTYHPTKLASFKEDELMHVIDDIACVYLMLRQYSEAEAMYQHALFLLFESKHYDPSKARKLSSSIYYQLGWIAQEQGEWEQAEKYYQQALKVEIENDDRQGQARTCHELGMVARHQRRWEQAEKYYQQALQIKIENGDRYWQARTYHELGVVAKEQREWEKAKRYYQQALQIKIEFDDRYWQGSTYHELGVVAKEQREWEKAKRYYQQALQIFIEYKDHHGQALAYSSLGVLEMNQGQWEQAKAYLLQAQQIFTEYSDHYSQAIVYSQLGVLEMRREQWEQAKVYLLQGLKTFKDMEDAYQCAIIMKNLAQIWWERGDERIVDTLTHVLEWPREAVVDSLRKAVGEEKH